MCMLNLFETSGFHGNHQQLGKALVVTLPSLGWSCQNYTWRLSTQGQMPLQALHSYPKRSESVKLHEQSLGISMDLYLYISSLYLEMSSISRRQARYRQPVPEHFKIPQKLRKMFMMFWQLAKDAYQLLLQQLAKKLAESGPPLDRLTHISQQRAFQARIVR